MPETAVATAASPIAESAGTRPQPGAEPRSGALQPSRALHVDRLGVEQYADALELQSRLVNRRRAGEITDTLLLLEHPHVITLGLLTLAGRIRGA